MAGSNGHNSVRVIVFALLANFGIAVSKFVGYFFTGSASLLAEAIHSLVDCSNQGLLLWGNKVSQKPADERHPLGYGREQFFWSFMVAIFLFSMGGLFAIYEGIHKLHGNADVTSPGLGLGILGFGIVLESISFMACLKEVRAQNRHGDLWTWFRKTTSSELLVIFTEDLAALVGLCVAAGFLVVAWITGDSTWDAMGSIAIGSILVIVALLLAHEIKSLMIGEAPQENYRAEIDRLAKISLPDSKTLHIIALQTGSNEVMLAVKIFPGSVATTDALVDGINRFEVSLKARFPEIKWLFVEPDVAD